MSFQANRYGFASTHTVPGSAALHLDINPPSDFSPFFDDFAPLPSPDPNEPLDEPFSAASTTSPISPRSLHRHSSTSTSTTTRAHTFPFRPPHQSDPASDPPLSQDPQAQIEEDKRRRNTEASARFRIKKKEREMQLERTAREMSERVGDLEERCKRLERENGWLRGLIVERREKSERERRRNDEKARAARERLRNGKGGDEDEDEGDDGD